MSVSGRKAAIIRDWKLGVRRCPCCNVQLVWRGVDGRSTSNVATVDHIVPKSKGGSNHSGNLFVMCSRCNHTRDTQCFVDFMVSKGFDKDRAESMFRDALIVSMTMLLKAVFVSKLDHVKAKKRANDLAEIATETFGKIPKEFEILPYNVHYKIG